MRFNNRAMALAGIPDLPEEAFKHCGDRKIKPQGGGSGGGSNTTTATTYTSSLPEYVQPQFERLLGQAEAFANSPYQAYRGQRQAEFTDLQNKGMQDVGNLGVTNQVGAGTELAAAGGVGSLGAGQQYAAQATNPGAVQAYMSPYMDAALAPQLREAARQSAIQGQQSQAQAVQQGAFGGSRSAIVEAERQRNLAQQQADIYGKGMQSAYEQAQKAQQFGADLGLKGYGQSLQAAQAMGDLGKLQFAQQEAAAKDQMAAGQLQQQLEQSKLDQKYQDFLTQRGYPQQQMAFLSDILHGAPVGGTTMQQYQAQPSQMSQLVGPGLLGLGMYKEFMK
jgi:hypothetical protein